MMDFAGFVQLIIQTSIYLHRKGRFPGVSAKQALGMMFVEMVYGLLEILRDQARRRNETPLQIYSISAADEVIES
jgi:hypothetical protein